MRSLTLANFVFLSACSSNALGVVLHAWPNHLAVFAIMVVYLCLLVCTNLARLAIRHQNGLIALDANALKHQRQGTQSR